MPESQLLQKVPNKQESGTSIFSDDVKTEQKSALFMKKLLAVAVSNITYLRGIYPERAYGDRCLEDLKLKILREESSCPGACQLIKWVKGCFDALDKKFLRVLIVGMYTDTSNPDTVIESYSFKFSYTDNNAEMDVYRNDEKISSSFSAVDTMRAAANLLRTIIVVIQSLKVLPQDVKMTMKLLYYDDVTPNDYEPPGFKAADYNTFQFEEEPVNFKVGDVSTPFHTVQLKIKTDGKQFLASGGEDSKQKSTNQQENEIEMVEKMDTIGEETEGLREAMESCDIGDHSRNAANVPHPEVADSVPSCPQPNRPEEQAVETTGSQSSQLTADGDNGVRCQCGCNEDDGIMILCAKCRFWQHGVCYKILDDEDAPERHICALCTAEDQNLQPTDPSLNDLTDIALEATCLWRRVLLFCSEVKDILAPTLAKRLGIEMVVARGLVSRLEKENYIKTHPKKKRLGKVVDKDNLKIGMQKYFKKTHQKGSTSGLEEQLSKSANDESNVSNDSKNVNKKEPKATQKEQNRNRKRGRLTINEQEYEYEMGNSQDLSQEVSGRKRRRKASIVATP